jgi:hypothetical protein
LTKKEAKNRFDNGLSSFSLHKWFDEIEKKELPNAEVNIGNLKIAFCYTFYFLWIASTKKDYKGFYEDCMKKTLLLGGDTDTNAAIVGGVIGALVGFEAFPRDWVETILTFDCSGLSHGRMKRDNFLIPKYHLVELAKKMYLEAPFILVIQCGQQLISDPAIIN